MDVRIRPEGLGHRQAKTITKRHLAVALLLSGGIWLSGTSSIQSATQAVDATASILPIVIHADHRIAVGDVGLGHEGISLSAQLGVDSTQAVSGVTWRIRRTGGDTIFSGVAAEATSLVLPGEYLVDAKYGPASFEEAFNVEPGQHLSVNLILNIGAVRILPTVPGVSDAAIKAVSKVFALSGLDRGKLVAQSQVPGEVIELMAGEYRVESHFVDGNAAAVSDVTIKPGTMSAIEFHHNAGIARLAQANNVGGPVAWIITGSTGEVISLNSFATRDVVLKPGHYSALAKFNGSEFQTGFDLAAGETQTITLGF
jgi:hypothetical protein